MSTQPGTPPLAAQRQYYPHSDASVGHDSSVASTGNRKSARKPRARPAQSSSAATATKPDYDQASDSPAHVSPSKSHGSRPSRAPGTATPKNSTKRNKSNTQNTGNQQHSSNSAQQDFGLDGTLSPQPSQPQRVTSQASSATPIKQAYAGPTFHASPAASTLPMPKFFSKSMPSQAAASGLQARLEAEHEGSESSTSESERPPFPPSPAAPFAREQSPLDLFFNAHRAERARQHSSDIGLTASNSTSQLSLEQLGSGTPHTPPYPRPSQPQSRQSNATPSGKEMFMMELDGAGEHDESDVPGPRVPFKDRINPTKAAAGPQPSMRDDETYRQAQSQALKKLLMTQPRSSSPLGLHTEPRHHSRQASAPFELHGSPGLARATPPQPYNGQQRPDVRSMENDLRRMLKLDP